MNQEIKFDTPRKIVHAEKKESAFLSSIKPIQVVHEIGDVGQPVIHMLFAHAPQHPMLNLLKKNPDRLVEIQNMKETDDFKVALIFNEAYDSGDYDK